MHTGIHARTCISPLIRCQAVASADGCPHTSQDPKDAMLRQYQEEIEKLKAMLAGQAGGPVDPAMFAAGGGADLREQNNRILEEEKQRLREEKEAELQEIEHRLQGDYNAKCAIVSRFLYL
jgi:hypothetical protein